MSDSLTITINNWELYQPRKDLTKLNWFRVETDIFDGETYFHLKNDGMIFFLFLLSKAAKCNNCTFDINLDFVCEKLKLKKADIFNILDKLKQKQLVHSSVRICTDLLPTNERTNITNITNITNNTELDFESAYNLYPLKKGKSQGLKRLNKDIKTSFDLDLFIKAVENYKKDLELNKTESKFFKHFSTFCGEWRDWIDYVPNLPTFKKNQNPISHAKDQMQRMLEDKNEQA